MGQQEDDGAADPGWIDCSKIDEFLSSTSTILVAVDGSDCSMFGFEWVTQDVMQSDRATCVEVLHIYDDAKTYLPARMQKSQIKAICEAKLTGSLVTRRYNLNMEPRQANIGIQIVNKIEQKRADFIVMGFFGRKGRKRDHLVASNTLEVMQRGEASVIVMQSEEMSDLPIGRPTKFVVSVSLNAASTKAFIDALRLSQPGDEIHVVYIKGYMERTDSDYTRALREKYAGFFDGLKDGAQQVLSKFGDRNVVFQMVPKQLRETTPCAVHRYCDDINADFVMVGTNRLRTARGKPYLGSVSLQIVTNTCRNFIVSNYSPPNRKL